MTISNVVLILAIVCVGIMSGLFFSFSFSVMPSLSQLEDDQYLSAMQSINRAIQNPVFFIIFFWVLISLPVATYFNYTQPVSAMFWLLLAATLLYFTGAFLVTAVGNIPLNNSLDKFELSSATKESPHHRDNYLKTGGLI